MILVDTSIWIDHLRCRDTRLINLLDRSQVLAHPFIIGEGVGRWFQTRLYHLHPYRRVSAGTTTKREQVGCHPDSPYAMPDKCLTAAPPVIPAKAGIQWFR